MKGRPVINFPSLGSVHSLGYLITIFLMMFCDIIIILNYCFFVTMSVPAVGAFQREPRLRWRVFSALTVTAACGFLLVQFTLHGTEGLVFYHASDPFGWTSPQVNLTSFLAVAMIFLPLSFACALQRILRGRSRKDQAAS